MFKTIAILGFLVLASMAQTVAQTPAPNLLTAGEILAIPNFTGPDGEMLASVVGSDLSHTGIFREVRLGDGAGSAISINEPPDASRWTAAGVRYVLVGTAIEQPDRRILVQVRLYDIANRTQLVGNQFRTLKAESRRISHLISDTIVKLATSKNGYFNTRIAFISQSPTGAARLAVMDQDGANQVLLTKGEYRASYPSLFDGFLIAYTTERDGREQALLFALESGKQRPIGVLPGSSRMPTFSPDGRTIALICETNGHADICLVETTTGRLIRTISHNGLVAFPSFSPDGKYLAFESGIGGAQGIFITDIFGARARQLASSSEKLGMPAWSPDGTKIAVRKFTQDGSRIAIMDADGSNLRELSSGAEDSRPAWAPNGQALLFTRTVSNGHQLWIVNVGNGKESLLPSSVDAGNASWSGLVNTN